LRTVQCYILFQCAHADNRAKTRTAVRLLGPCYKTGERRKQNRACALPLLEMRAVVVVSHARSNPVSDLSDRSSNDATLRTHDSSACAQQSLFLDQASDEPCMRLSIALTLRLPPHTAPLRCLVPPRDTRLEPPARHGRHDILSLALIRTPCLRTTRASNQRPVLHSPSTSTISSPFHLSFDILFSFPSQYLYAIGLSPLFSFASSLRRALSSTLKLLDS